MNPDPSPQPRLNPFVWPLETDVRLILLVLVTLGSSLFCLERLAWLRSTVQPELGQRFAQMEPCFEQTRANWFDNLQIVDACLRESVGLLPVSGLQSQLVGLGLILLLVLVVYSLLPTVIVRRERLVPLDRQPPPDALPDALPENIPESLFKSLTDAYAELCQEIEIARPPQLMLKATSRRSGPCIFGCWGRYFIVVPGGLTLRFQADPASFRAVMLHELSHLKNRDVDKTYLAFAMGLAFVAIAFLPMVAVSVWSAVTQGVLADLWATTWRGLLLLLVMYLTLAAVVRSREYYADLRAALWAPQNDRLTKLLGETLGPKASGWQTKLLRLMQRVPWLHRYGWDYALQFYPDPQYRTQILAHPDGLFQLNFWVALGMGLSMTLIAQQMLGHFETVRQFSPLSNPENGFIVLGIIFGSGLAAICALGVWRMAFAQRLHQATGPSVRSGGGFSAGASVGKVGLGLALGIATSLCLSFDAAATLSQIDGAASLLKVLGFNFVWFGVLTLCLVCFAHWVSQSARLWLSIAVKRRSLLWVCSLGMVVASPVMVLGLGWLLLVRDLGQAFVRFSEVGIGMLAALFLYIGYLAQHPFTLVVCTLLWLFPLSAWLWPRRSGAIPAWAFLDRLTDPPTDASTPAIAPQGKPLFHPLFHSVKRGVLGGLVFVAMLLLLQVLLRRLVPEVTLASDGFDLFFYYGVSLGMAVLVQWIVALFTPRHPSYTHGFGVIHGLFSVAVSGLIMAVGILWLNVTFGETADAQFVKETFVYTLNLGTMVALPTLLLSVGLFGAAGRR
ncbi:MAG: M48 family metalloprotease [Cyanobacteria bacterium P01_A01_bin.114]